VKKAPSTKHQAPSSREAPNIKLQSPEPIVLVFGALCFFGAWSLEFGALKK
jgi:hypothetical protein